MPTYRVHYFVVKRLYLPVGTSVTGTTTTVSPFSPDGDPVREIILGHFEEKLREFMTNALHRVRPSWSVQINRIRDSATSGTPDFSAVSPVIHGREPIVYMVLKPTSSIQPNAGDLHDRRASLTMFEAIGDNFVEIPASFAASGRSLVQSALSSPRGEEGQAAHSSDYVPCVAEVFSNPRIAYDDERLRQNMGYHLARVAFHEIAHCKAECVNRPSPSGNPWHEAISGDIHSTPGLCSSPPALQQTEEDQILMSRHMLCPIPFYKLDQPIGGQFFTQGASVQLTPRTSAPSVSPGGGEEGASLDVDSLDDIL